jgi:alkanesulfonate monooxygenase SsuD/methylene tetrahydromethanopterin reductase-like flavin-dependent oxidoreductase (luciferase family)
MAAVALPTGQGAGQEILLAGDGVRKFRLAQQTADWAVCAFETNLEIVPALLHGCRTAGRSARSPFLVQLDHSFRAEVASGILSSSPRVVVSARSGSS